MPSEKQSSPAVLLHLVGVSTCGGGEVVSYHPYVGIDI